MPHYFALLSIVFMTSFVLLFDSIHLTKSNNRFTKNCLMSDEDIHQLRDILSACQES